MKKLNLTILLAVLLSMEGTRAFAHDIEVKNADGVTIYYVWTNNNTELAVSYEGTYSNGYSGEVAIPDSVIYEGVTYSVTSISAGAFGNCRGLTSITIPSSVISIDDEAFAGCSSLTSVTIGNGVTFIADEVFVYCSSLTSITIPNSVEYIGEFAFYECSNLTSVIIGSGVTFIGEGAFLGCSSLTSVTSYINSPFEIACCFEGSQGNNSTLYVPKGKVEVYKSTVGWNVFTNIVEMKQEDTDISKFKNVIYVEKTEAFVNSNVVLSVQMKNSAAIREFQFDLYLPEGVTVEKNNKGRFDAFLSTGRLGEGDEHTLTVTPQADGSYRFLCCSIYEETFLGNDGEIVTVKLNIAENMENGDYPLYLRGIVLTENDINKKHETNEVKSTLTISSYIMGDVNVDNTVDVRDYIGIANQILGNTPLGFNEKAADVNEDGFIDVSDYIGIANLILYGTIDGK